MKIEVTRTREGWPQVAWIQEAAESGATFGGRKTAWAVIFGAVAGMLIGVYAAGPQGFFFGGAAGAVFMLLAIGHQEKERGAPDPRDAEPILEKQYAELKVVEGRDTLLLAWSLKGKRMKDDFVIPLAEATELSVGTFNEWFGGQTRRGHYHESLVIVLPHPSGTVFCVADHAGARADVAALHGTLVRHIVGARDHLLREFRERAEAAAALREEAAPETPETI